MKTTIDRAGRVVIPKAIRERAGFQPGSELDIRLDNGVIEITQRSDGRLVEKNGFLMWEPTPGTPPIAVETIDQAIEDARNERGDAIIRAALGLEDEDSFRY